MLQDVQVWVVVLLRCTAHGNLQSHQPFNWSQSDMHVRATTVYKVVWSCDVACAGNMYTLWNYEEVRWLGSHKYHRGQLQLKWLTSGLKSERFPYTVSNSSPDRCNHHILFTFSSRNAKLYACAQGQYPLELCSRSVPTWTMLKVSTHLNCAQVQYPLELWSE